MPKTRGYSAHKRAGKQMSSMGVGKQAGKQKSTSGIAKRSGKQPTSTIQPSGLVKQEVSSVGQNRQGGGQVTLPGVGISVKPLARPQHSFA